MKKQLKTMKQKLGILIYLFTIFVLISCQTDANTTSSTEKGNHNTLLATAKQQKPVTNEPKEIILFCGNPGVGKSTLCNSMIGEIIFNSGTSTGTGMTKNQQSQLCGNQLYVDTPGLEDIKMKDQAAEEIEKALKKNNKYKIIFVVTLESGRIRPSDFVTINIVCDAIKTDFEYGIIFNKIPQPTLRKIMQRNQDIEKYLILSKKKPFSLMFMSKNDDIEDADNVCLDPENTENLRNFISKLPAYYIDHTKITPLDVRDYEAKVAAAETEYKEGLLKLQQQLEQSQKDVQELQHNNKEDVQRLENNKKILEEQEALYQEHKKRLEEQSTELQLEQEKYIQAIQKTQRELEAKLKLKNEQEAEIRHKEEQNAKIKNEIQQLQKEFTEKNFKAQLEKLEKQRKLEAEEHKKTIDNIKKERKQLKKRLEEQKKESQIIQTNMMELQRLNNELNQYQQQQTRQSYQQTNRMETEGSSLSFDRSFGELTTRIIQTGSFLLNKIFK